MHLHALLEDCCALTIVFGTLGMALLANRSMSASLAIVGATPLLAACCKGGTPLCPPIDLHQYSIEAAHGLSKRWWAEASAPVGESRSLRNEYLLYVKRTDGRLTSRPWIERTDGR